MAEFRWGGYRKRRTREHVIEEMSVNFLERKILERGHMLVRAPQREYGWDATMFHFSPETGEIENGEVRIQLKATDHLDYGREFATCRIQTKDLRYWYWEDQQIPFVVVLYDAQRHRGFWVAVREYVDQWRLDLDHEQRTVDLHIPWANRVTLRTIDRFRKLSLARMERERGMTS
jgi:hypothetical protein